MSDLKKSGQGTDDSTYSGSSGLADNRGQKICFFLGNITTPFEGLAKAFINWGLKLLDYNNEVHFVLLNCNKRVGDSIKVENSNFFIKEIKNPIELFNLVRTMRPDIIISDDDLQRLKLIACIKAKIKIKTCIYCQILFAVHSLVDVFDLRGISPQKRVLFEILRIIPFSLLKRPYRNLLRGQDLIIANSQTTASWLHILYGIEPNEVIYPAINPREFNRELAAKKVNGVLLYLGSHGGDMNEDFIRKICRILQKQSCKIVVLGNKQMQEKLKNEFNLIGVSDITDGALAKIYSQSKFTICPQKWEMFGYVVAESISCGTPVLAFNLMGPSEIISQSKMGFLANNEKEFLFKVEDFNFENNNNDIKKSYYPWDMDYSGKRLNEVIKDTIGQRVTKT
jgi:glycosyltransferase involved in cell wall biosynthesis